MNYIIYEDNWQHFLPFTYTRFTGDMRVGILKLRQRIGLAFDFESKHIITRKAIESLYKERHPDWQINSFPTGEYTFINTAIKIDDTLQKEIETLQIGQKLVAAMSPTPSPAVLAFKIQLPDTTHLTAEDLPALSDPLTSIISKHSEPLWQYIWQFIAENGKMIKNDYDLVFYDAENLSEIDPGVVALNPYDIWIGENATLGHNVILDARSGAIVIDEGATIMHNAVIVGPAFIGKNTIIKIGAKIYQNTSIGANCKVGGEVEGTIIQAYSNKQHDGFLGHSYIGEWVNIGADTNNSDLKNNYAPVKVWFYPTQSKIPTENMFIGVFIADHTKIGINCSINTGSVIGFGSNLYGGDLISDFVPSFSWGTAKSLVKYHFDKFIETSANVKLRRKETLTSAEINLIKQIYNHLDEYEEIK